MVSRKAHPDELRERAVKLVFEVRAETGNERTVRVWDLATSRQTVFLEGHRGVVSALCPVAINGQARLASASHDRYIRIWDPNFAGCLAAIPVHHEALALTWTDDALVVGLTDGVLVIDLDIAALV